MDNLRLMYQTQHLIATFLKLNSVVKDVLEIDQDATSNNNVFSNNQVMNSASPTNTITNEIHKENNSEMRGSLLEKR